MILPVCGSASLLSAVGLLGGEIVVGDRALTDALAQELSVRFKSRFTTDPASYEDVVRFVRGVLSDLRQSARCTRTTASWWAARPAGTRLRAPATAICWYARGWRIRR